MSDAKMGPNLKPIYYPDDDEWYLLVPKGLAKLDAAGKKWVIPKKYLALMASVMRDRRTGQTKGKQMLVFISKGSL